MFRGWFSDSEDLKFLDHPDEKIQKPLPHLPDDILLEIASTAVWQGHSILQLVVLNKRIYELFLPVLYSSVHLRCCEQCQVILPFLTQTPEIARHIRRLVISPNNGVAITRKILRPRMQQAWTMVQFLATKGSLVDMTEFSWDGVALPSNSFWAALQSACPNLRSLRIRIGPVENAYVPLHVPALFSFSNLTTFSLVCTDLCTFSSHNLLKDMLCQRCPNLADLELLGVTYPTTDLVGAVHWPRLHSISLSYIGNVHAFLDFLELHPTLRVLKTRCAFWIDPALLASKKLPFITSLTTQWTRTTPFSPEPLFPSLTSLDLSEDTSACNFWVVDITCAQLHSFLNLVDLSVQIGRTDLNNIPSVLNSCPKLISLQLSSQEFFHTDECLRTIFDAPDLKLESLVVNKPMRFLPESVTDSVTMWLSSRKFSLPSSKLRISMRLVSPWTTLTAPLVVREAYDYVVTLERGDQPWWFMEIAEKRFTENQVMVDFRRNYRQRVRARSLKQETGV